MPENDRGISAGVQQIELAVAGLDLQPHRTRLLSSSNAHHILSVSGFNIDFCQLDFKKGKYEGGGGWGGCSVRVNDSDINSVAPLRLIKSLERLLSKTKAEPLLHKNWLRCEGMDFIRNVMVHILQISLVAHWVKRGATVHGRSEARDMANCVFKVL